MNLEKLFKMQKELDERILDRFPELRNEDLLDKKILALQVELGELAQNWRGFKFWSHDQEPRTEIFITSPKSNDPLVVRKNPLLEEYVDCLHFILSIGNEDKSYSDFDMIIIAKFENIIEQFREMFKRISDFDNNRNWMTYKDILSTFMGLGEMLGFTWEQIEQAYFDKNKINHQRQENGY